MVLHNLLFLGTALAGTLLIVALAFVIGRAGGRLLRLRFDSFPEEAACSIAVGLGTIALIVFLLGIGGFLYFRVLVPAIVLLLAASFFLLRNVARPVDSLKNVPRSHLLLALLIVLGLVPLFLLPLYPPTASDALTYHLATAQQYAHTGSVQPTPQYRYAVFPLLVDMLFTAALIVGSDIMAQCVSLIFLLVTSLAVIAFVRRLGFGASSSWGAALVLSNSAVLVLAGVALTDMALTAFVTLAVLSFERWHESRDDAWLVFSGAMTGCAAGTKYSALFFPLILGGLSILVPGQQRRMRSLLKFALSFVITAMPWYAYNAWHTGNPVWPFFSTLFGHAYWNDADVRGQTADLLTVHGTGTGIAALLLLPWNLFRHPEYFHTEGEFSVSVMVGIPFALYEVVRKGYARRIAIVGLSFGLFWFFTAQILRYLIPILPLACVLASAGMSRLFERFFPSPGPARMLAVLVVALLLILPGWRFATHRVASMGPPPVTPEARDQFLEKRFSSYGAIRNLEQHVGSSYTLYSYGDPRMAYFTGGAFRGDHFGPWRYSGLTDLLDGKEDDLARELNRMGVDYLLVSAGSDGSECKPDWLERRLVVPVFRTPGAILFAVKGNAQSPVYGPEAVCRGTGLSESAAAEGVRFGGRGGEMYYSSCVGKAQSMVTTVLFQLIWLAEDGRRIRTDEMTGVFTPKSDTLRILSTAPSGAVTALISCSPIGEGSVSIGSLSLRTIRFEPSAR